MNQKELLQIIEQAAKKRVTSLNLSGKGLSELPLQIAQLTNLTRLELSNNHLRELPPQIARLTNLTRLELSNNHLRELPREIGQFRDCTLNAKFPVAVIMVNPAAMSLTTSNY